MNDRTHFAELATKALAAEPIPTYLPDPREEERIIQAMAERIRRDARRRTVRRAATVFAAAATFALAGAAALLGRHHGTVATVTLRPAPAPQALETAHATGEHSSIVHLGAELALNGDVALAEGDRVVASGTGQAAIRLPSGTRVAIEPGGQVSMMKQGLMQMFALDMGSIRAEVAPLADGERFIVRTPDAEVEVRGTAFHLTTGSAVACGGHSTRVDVETGTVVVRSGGKEERVIAGARWPATCDVAEDLAATPKGQTRRGHTKHVSTPAETSELKAQTQLYGEAIVAKRSGDARGAVARFDEYLSLYPESALAEAAAVNRMELLEPTDHARAAAAAREYLQRYPHGHSRDEATRISGSP